MNKYCIYIFIGIILLNCEALPHKLQIKNSRIRNPVGIKLGYYEGIGLDVNLGPIIGFDATTLILINSIKIRLYMFDNNSSPFFGLGYGSMEKSISDGGIYSYALVYCGMEVGDENVFVQASIQFPFHKKVREDFSVIPSLSIGYRF